MRCAQFAAHGHDEGLKRGQKEPHQCCLAIDAELLRLIAANGRSGTVLGNVVDLDVGRARESFESKYWGQYHCAEYAAPHLTASGSMVLFSGLISRKPMAGVSTLAALDAALKSQVPN